MYGGYENFEDYESELYNNSSEDDEIQQAEQLLYSKIHYNVKDLDTELLPNGIEDIDSYIRTHAKRETEYSSEEEWTIINDRNAEKNDNSNGTMEINVLGIGSGHNWFVNTDDIKARIDNNSSKIVRRNQTSKKIPLRYSSVRCRNCNKAGHLSNMCPSFQKIPSCFLCGTKGHKAHRCPNELCFNCGCPGHQKFKCTKRKRQRNDKCYRCTGFGHIRQECSEHWRQYHKTTSSGPIKKPKPGTRKTNAKVYCFNCGKRGHFGSECNNEKMTKFITFLSPFIRHYDYNGLNTKEKLDSKYNTKEKTDSKYTDYRKKGGHKRKINGVNNETMTKKSKSDLLDITIGDNLQRKVVYTHQKESKNRNFETQKPKRLKNKKKKKPKLRNEKCMNTTDRGFRMSKNKY